MIETIALVLTGLSITASIVYYASILRNANKTQQQQLETRQTQLMMQIYQNLNSEATCKAWAELVNMDIDYDDYVQNYDSSVNPAHFAKRSHIWSSYNTIGELLRLGMIDSDRLSRLSLGPLVIVMWERWANIINKTRVRENAPDLWEGFEYLYNEMIKFREKKELPDMKYPI